MNGHKKCPGRGTPAKVSDRGSNGFCFSGYPFMALFYFTTPKKSSEILVKNSISSLCKHLFKDKVLIR